MNSLCGTMRSLCAAGVVPIYFAAEVRASGSFPCGGGGACCLKFLHCLRDLSEDCPVQRAHTLLPTIWT